MNFLGCVALCAKKYETRYICLVYNCNKYIYIRYIPIFHVVSDVCPCILAGFHEAHHSNQQVNPMNLPHISVADQFDESDIELLDVKVLTIRSDDSFPSAPPWKL
jgi:hypothetical protein